MDRSVAFAALIATDPVEKVRLTRAALAAPDMTGNQRVLAAGTPGRPAQPQLVHPARVPQRGLGTAAGRAALLHAITHIEFNAINIALDALCRFGGMPAAYYRDWMQVAGEEALHFSLLAAHLQSLGHTYGDLSAHNGLWEMADLTQNDVLARMALVPRILEARGLDVTPAIRAKLAHQGDLAAAEILDVILADEVGHVAIGNQWYRWLCEQRGVDPREIFGQLMIKHRAPKIRPPFNRPARLAGGFTVAELDGWEADC